MRILLYAADPHKIPEELILDIQKTLPDGKIEIVTSISDLSDTLCRPLNKVLSIVAWPGGPGEISFLNSLKHLFDNIRIILVLPDRERLVLSLGIRLKPSFITYPDNNPDDIVTVLRQIQKIKEEV